MTTIANCRSCGESGLQPVLSLGNLPLANALLNAEDKGKTEERFQLDLVFCPACTLVQITETVAPEKLFGEYVYFSSFGDAMVKNMAVLAGQMVQKQSLNAESLVVELASNDGYLLQFYKQKNVPVLGIEPAANVAKVAEEKRGIPTRVEFFSQELAQKLVAEGKRADVIHANNVLAHVADLNGFVAGIAALLKDNGVAVVEVPYVAEMVANGEFDTIYHEHLCYFSFTSLRHLFKRHGLTIQDVQQLAIHGGSLRIYATPTASNPKPSAAVTALWVNEQDRGVTQYRFYQDFAGKVEMLKGALIKQLKECKAGGRRIAAYGAAAKGTQLLNAFGIGTDLVEYVCDRSGYKQGKLMPGTHQPIVPPEQLAKDAPDYCLMLAWNFADEIMQQQAEFRRKGGKFIIPLPALKIV